MSYSLQKSDTKKQQDQHPSTFIDPHLFPETAFENRMKIPGHFYTDIINERMFEQFGRGSVGLRPDSFICARKEIERIGLINFFAKVNEFQSSSHGPFLVLDSL